MITRSRRRLLGGLAATVVGATVGVAGFGGVASAEDPYGELLIAMDFSGSMEESDGAGGTRIEAARTAVDGVAEAMPDGSNVGFRAFGPSGCDASELMVPVGPVDRDALAGAADGLDPDGDTPIAHSLTKAAEDFTDAEGPKTILLVSDGEETCGGDPVKVAEEITSQGVDVRVHVIGFLVESEARDQLADVAAAGKGAYYDAQDGPALASRLQRAAEHSIRGYDTSGTPVDGSDDGLNLPVLTPGQYVDAMPPDTEDAEPSKFYAFDLPEDTHAYVAATVPWSTPLEVDAKNAVGVEIRREAQDSGRCERETDHPWRQKGGSVPATAMAQLAWDPEADAEECGGAGRYVVEVDNADNADRHGPAPLELVLVLEPALSTTDGLPEPYVEEKAAATPDVDSSPVDVVGAGSFGDAPILETGKFNDVLRPGEQLHYRVPVDWGQRLAYQFDLPKVDEEIAQQLGSSVSVKSTVMNPLRTEALQKGSNEDATFSGGDPKTVDGSTTPVRHRNRASDDDATANTSLSGYYYVTVQMSADADDPYFALPITLTVDVQGDPEGVPQYDDVNGLGTPAEQLEVDLASHQEADEEAASGGKSAALWAGVVVGAVLAVGGGTAAWIFFRRKPTPTG
ncbi:MAG: vWA domain-containing protein [Stackebrandtia sp.]